METYYSIFDKKPNLGLHINKKLFYLTDETYIYHHYYKGTYLGVIEIPYNEPNLVKNYYEEYLTTNMIIIKKIYNFNDLNDFQEIYKINNNRDIVTFISNSEIFDWLNSKNFNFKSILDKIIIHAANNGDCDIIKWLHKSNYKLHHLNYIIECSLKNGYVEILDYFKNLNYVINCDKNIMSYICLYGKIITLEWLKKSNCEINYNIRSIMYASYSGHINILNWFKNYNHNFVKNKYAINQAVCSGKVVVLEWFKINKYYFKHDKKIILKCNSKDVLNWFITNNFKQEQYYIKKYIKKNCYL
jgi:hypothetical protein